MSVTNETRNEAIEAVNAYLRSREYSDFSETPFVVDAALSAGDSMYHRGCGTSMGWRTLGELV